MITLSNHRVQCYVKIASSVPVAKKFSLLIRVIVGDHLAHKATDYKCTTHNNDQAQIKTFHGFPTHQQGQAKDKHVALLWPI